MKKVSFVAAIALLLSLCSFMWQGYRVPTYFPSPLHAIPDAQRDAAKIQLGRFLFYDPILSADSTISCASCHTSFNSFAHTDHPLSHGLHDSIGTRNAPALINLAWQQSYMWDGAIVRLDAQSLAPITHPAEMGETIAYVLQKLNRSSFYQKAFQKVFKKKTIVTADVLQSLEAFELTLISANAKYDQVRMGKAQFTLQEQKGYVLFKKHCNTCHTEPLFTNASFENNGLPPDSILQDLGRYRITLQPTDSLRFKVPTLRNVAFSYPYMHDGRYPQLSQVLRFYAGKKFPSSSLSPSLQNPLPLNDSDRVELLSFLLTLSDTSFVLDEDFAFPKRLLAAPR